MRKKPANYHRWRWRIGVLGIAFMLLLAVLRFSIVLSPPETSSSLELELPMKNVNNSETVAAPKPKVAFLFLARNRMPLDILWELFFKGAQEHMYTILIHARPGFVYDKTNTQCSYFWNRQINDGILVEWGEASMIDAERVLLRKALEDPSISHFVLLSDSCIPLYSFSYVYDYITSSSKSFVDSFMEAKETRYNAHMYPTISKEQWRKGSQWFVLIRKHAEAVVADKTILQTFQEHCKRFSQLRYKASRVSGRQPKRVVLPESGRKYGVNIYSRSENDCVPDEHYIQTLLAIKGLEDEIERRSVTYTLWKASDKGRQTDRWHPVTFHFGDVSPHTIKDIQGIHSIKYDTEGRTEWCSSNGVPRACYLFARKFSRAAVIRLLRNNETDFFGFAAAKIPNNA